MHGLLPGYLDLEVHTVLAFCSDGLRLVLIFPPGGVRLACCPTLASSLQARLVMSQTPRAAAGHARTGLNLGKLPPTKSI